MRFMIHAEVKKCKKNSTKEIHYFKIYIFDVKLYNVNFQSTVINQEDIFILKAAYKDNINVTALL